MAEDINKKLSIHTATLEELQQVDGIGEVYAKKIIAERDAIAADENRRMNAGDVSKLPAKLQGILLKCLDFSDPDAIAAGATSTVPQDSSDLVLDLVTQVSTMNEHFGQLIQSFGKLSTDLTDAFSAVNKNLLVMNKNITKNFDLIKPVRGSHRDCLTDPVTLSQENSCGFSAGFRGTTPVVNTPSSNLPHTTTFRGRARGKVNPPRNMGSVRSVRAPDSGSSEDDSSVDHYRVTSRYHYPRSRTPKYRGSYSPYSQYSGYDHGGDKIKIQPFDGSVPWRAWFRQFQQVSSRMPEESEEDKLVRLQSCFSGRALVYYGLLPDSEINDYHVLTQRMSSRFGSVESAKTAQNQLAILRQRIDESIDEYAQRALTLAMDAYAQYEPRVIHESAVQAFLRGATETDAGIAVMDQNPIDMDDAKRRLKDCVSNRMLFRRKSTQSAVRNLEAGETLADGAVDESELAISQVTANNFSGHQRRVHFQKNPNEVSLSERVTRLEKQMSANSEKLASTDKKLDSQSVKLDQVLQILASSVGNSSNRYRNSSPNRGYHSSPQRSRTPSPGGLQTNAQNHGLN